MDEKIKKQKKLGYFFFILFAVFIVAGIIHKRVFDGPEFMMLWHVPAAVFLVIAGKKLTSSNRARYYQNKSNNFTSR